MSHPTAEQAKTREEQAREDAKDLRCRAETYRARGRGYTRQGRIDAAALATRYSEECDRWAEYAERWARLVEGLRRIVETKASPDSPKERQSSYLGREHRRLRQSVDDPRHFAEAVALIGHAADRLLELEVDITALLREGEGGA